MAVHEAGHAIVAMALGIDVVELRIGESGGTCTRFEPSQRRSWHACASLGGHFAVAIHCRDCPEMEAWNGWENCSEDLQRWNDNRGGMSYRNGRRLTLRILRDHETELLALARTLEREGFVDSTNAPFHGLAS